MLLHYQKYQKEYKLKEMDAKYLMRNNDLFTITGSGNSTLATSMIATEFSFLSGIITAK